MRFYLAATQTQTDNENPSRQMAAVPPCFRRKPTRMNDYLSHALPIRFLLLLFTNPERNKILRKINLILVQLNSTSKLALVRKKKRSLYFFNLGKAVPAQMSSQCDLPQKIQLVRTCKQETLLIEKAFVTLHRRMREKNYKAIFY